MLVLAVVFAVGKLVLLLKLVWLLFCLLQQVFCCCRTWFIGFVATVWHLPPLVLVYLVLSSLSVLVEHPCSFYGLGV